MINYYLFKAFEKAKNWTQNMLIKRMFFFILNFIILIMSVK